MKKLVTFAFAITITGSSAGMVAMRTRHRSDIDPTILAHASDAAFQDGLYQAYLDAKAGKQRVAVARWNSTVDRQSFSLGYEIGRRQSHSPPNGSDAH